MKIFLVLLFSCFAFFANAQQGLLVIKNQFGRSVEHATILLAETKVVLESDSSGLVRLAGSDCAPLTVTIVAFGYEPFITRISPCNNDTIRLKENATYLQEVTVQSDAAAQAKSQSAFNTDLLSAKFFQKSTSSNLFEAAALVPGVRPQVNCNVCNTGEIRINGMDGPYTLVLIDNIPVISALSSVYGLMGIPSALIENVEVSKGPASAFYGSEAMAGIIAITTKHADEADRLALDVNTGTYREHQLDLSFSKAIKKQIFMMGALNMFSFQNKVDLNKDNFTDLSLQNRISGFLKITFKKHPQKPASIAIRGVYEDRWGGQMNWNKHFRAGDSVYGESIYTKRLELIGNKEWGTALKLKTDYSIIYHQQDAAYGSTNFLAEQVTAYSQTYFKRQLNSQQEIELGQSVRYMRYDDNTAATQAQLANGAENTFLTGLFAQHTLTGKKSDKLLLSSGLRMDWHSVYGFIPTPRAALRLKVNSRLSMRLNIGSGYRVVNVFTEDHAALSGARKVVFLEKIKPEQSLSTLFNFNYKLAIAAKHLVICDASFFYYHFYNKISANYEQQGLIVYKNLNGFAFSRGLALAANYPITKGFSASVAYNFTDVQFVESVNGQVVRRQQWYSPKHSALFSISELIKAIDLKCDVTAAYTGSQRLPIQQNDFRAEYAPAYWLLNLLFTKMFSKGVEVYLGVKNVFDFLPVDPLMRPYDPFNKQINDAVQNPNTYVFDTTYNYAPFQRRRCTVGIRYKIK